MSRLLTTLPLLLLIGSLNQIWAHPESHLQGLRHKEIASPDPDRIFLSFNGDPATRRGVNWRTDTSIEKAFAEIAIATGNPNFQDGAVRLPAVTEKFDMNASYLNKQGIVHYHSVTFVDLLPDTLYAYRVGDGTKYWSEWIQFRTAAADDSPFTFLYFGDAQNDIFSRWARVIRMAYQTAPDAQFAIHAGDIVNHGHTDVEWAEWFNAGAFLHSQLTGVPVCGNHEYRPLNQDKNSPKVRSIHWQSQFNLPIDQDVPQPIQESVYTVEYQNLQIIVLDSNGMIAEQAAYLEKQLQKQGFDWRVVTYHHSLYSPKGRDGDNYGEMFSLWVPLFNKYGVDLVLQGHDHLYSRGNMDPGLVGRKDAGPVYVTTVSGPKQYAMVPEAVKELVDGGYKTYKTGTDTQYFQAIHVDGGTLSYKAYNAVGKLHDSFKLSRRQQDGVKVMIQD